MQIVRKILNPVARAVRALRDNHRRYNDIPLPPEIYDDSIPKRSVSFCTTCKNRFWHLHKTFLKNIEDNRDYPGVEFVLINYNSEDELEDWAREVLLPYIEAGLVNYYRTPEPDLFHASIAKNLAHKVAKGDIVCNVDGDNFTGRDFAFFLNHQMYLYGDDTIFHIKKAPYWGTEGRIALTRANFVALGGYDESLESIGHQDHDLINRATALGLKYHNVQVENFLHYLSNTRYEKSVNCKKEFTDYYEILARNKKRSNDNIAAGRLHANPNGWGMLPMYKNFSEEAKVYEIAPVPLQVRKTG